MSDEQFSLDVDVGRAALSVHTSAPQRFSCPCVCVRTPRRRDSRFEPSRIVARAAATEECPADIALVRRDNANAGSETRRHARKQAVHHFYRLYLKAKASATPYKRILPWIQVPQKASSPVSRTDPTPRSAGRFIKKHRHDGSCAVRLKTSLKWISQRPR